MTDTVCIRHASLGDADAIVAFNAALAEETESRSLDRATLRDGVRQALRSEGTCLYFVAERGRRVVGQCMVTFEWSDWRNGWLWWFQSVYVHPEHRRNGVFSALYKHVETQARSRPDVAGLRLYVEQRNHRAMNTYTRLGMSPSGHLVYEKDFSVLASAAPRDA